jgi:hypothetical protein
MRGGAVGARHRDAVRESERKSNIHIKHFRSRPKCNILSWMLCSPSLFAQPTSRVDREKSYRLHLHTLYRASPKKGSSEGLTGPRSGSGEGGKDCAGKTDKHALTSITPLWNGQKLCMFHTDVKQVSGKGRAVRPSEQSGLVRC